MYRNALHSSESPQTLRCVARWNCNKQWRAEVWWCPGRLLHCMPPTKF